jgi:hypothetical protein
MIRKIVTNRLTLRQLALLLGITAAALAVHGYHPYIEDAEIYLPGIKKLLNPALYPYNTGFFASQGRMTLFPNLIAASVRTTHLPLDWALLLWQAACVFTLLLGCWRIGRAVFPDPLASWGGVALVSSLLTIPVAGTALYIMDQYLNTRSLSTASVLMIVANVTERRYLRAGLWTLFTAVIHPLMIVFGISFALVLIAARWISSTPRLHDSAVAMVLPLGLFPPVSRAYHEALQNRSYFFLLRWEWYEWVGVFAPFVVFWWFQRIARKQRLAELDLMCKALTVFGLLFLVLALAITVPVRFERFALLQPMRYLHLTYVLLFTFSGGLLAHFLLRRHIWRWLILFVPLCGGMFFAQRELFPATPHLELPGTSSPNPWVQSFLWIRDNTPVDAYFALNPDHMGLETEDQHGFRALAERSMLADKGKDSAAVSLFPALAETWQEQVRSQSGWKSFQRADFARLKQTYGVNWIVLEKPSTLGFSCPYENAQLMVCRLD